MTIALWIVGILALLAGAVSFWLIKTCGDTDGDMGQAFAGYFFGILALVFSLSWLVLAFLHWRS